MSQPIDAGAVEVDAYRSRWDDGLFDLFVGLSLLWIGGCWIWIESFAGLAGVLPAIFVVPFITFRTRFIEDRAGYVRFSAARRKWERRNLVLLLVFGVGTFIGGIVVYFAVQGNGLSAVAEWAAPGLIAWLAAIPVLIVAVTAMLPRLFAYAGVLIASGFVAARYETNPGVPLVIAGVLVTVWGMVLLGRFVQKHPKPAAA